MKTIKFILNKNGVRELLKSQEIQSACMDKARQMQQKAGSGYVAESRNYPERSGAAVYPGSEEAVFDNLSHNTLEKVKRI